MMRKRFAGGPMAGRGGRVLLAAAAPWLAGAAALQARSELPIRQTVLQKTGGPERPIYGVPVRIGATVVETGLDTGSIGLRILPHTLQPGDARPTSQTDSYAYGSGVRLTGVVGAARIGFGGEVGLGNVQLVETVDCLDAQPHCPASQVGGQENYGLQGQGIPGAGFRAIAGLRFTPPKPGLPANPLVAIGAERYLIQLPRRGEAFGSLVVDPAADETEGFVALPDAGAAFGDAEPANTVPGCLRSQTTGREICGAILFDTGAPGIHVTLPSGRFEDWPLGTPARLVLGDGAGRALAVADFTAGPVHYGHVGGGLPRPGLSRPFLSVGVTPFLAFAVLYEKGRHGIAVRPRPPMPGGPAGYIP